MATARIRSRVKMERRRGLDRSSSFGDVKGDVLKAIAGRLAREATAGRERDGESRKAQIASRLKAAAGVLKTLDERVGRLETWMTGVEQKLAAQG